MTTANGSAPLSHKPTPAELQGAVSQAISEVRRPEDCLFVCTSILGAWKVPCAGVSFKQNFTCVGLTRLVMGGHRNSCRGGRSIARYAWFVLAVRLHCAPSLNIHAMPSLATIYYVIARPKRQKQQPRHLSYP